MYACLEVTAGTVVRVRVHVIKVNIYFIFATEWIDQMYIIGLQQSRTGTYASKERHFPIRLLLVQKVRRVCLSPTHTVAFMALLYASKLPYSAASPIISISSA